MVIAITDVMFELLLSAVKLVERNFVFAKFSRTGRSIPRVGRTS